MKAAIMENGKVEIRSKSGEVLIMDQGTYELAQGLLKLAKETSPCILRAAAQQWAADPEGKKESKFLAQFVGMYLDRYH